MYPVVFVAHVILTVPAELSSVTVIFEAVTIALPDAAVVDMASAIMAQLLKLLLVRITKPRTVPSVRVIVILPPPVFEPV